MAVPSTESGPLATAQEIPLEPAEIYELFAVPALFAPAAERLLAVARPLPGERVLDVGTGTGIVARLAAPRVGATGSVTGLDADAGMLNVARAAAERENLAISWIQGQAERLPFPDAGFDLVLSQYALMFFRDPSAALAETWRVLAPAGRATFSVFQSIAWHPFYQALDQAIARHLGRSTVAAIFALGDADALGALVANAGFRDVSIEPFSRTLRLGPPQAFLPGEIAIDTASIPTMQGLTAADRQALVEAIVVEIKEPLDAVTKDGQVIMDFHDFIVCANR